MEFILRQPVCSHYSKILINNLLYQVQAGNANCQNKMIVSEDYLLFFQNGNQLIF